MNHSTFVRDLNERQKLWMLDKPIPYEQRIRGESGNILGDDVKIIQGATHYVVSSRCVSMTESIQGCPEVYIFAADSVGNVLDWRELPGSQKGTTDHNLVMSESEFPPKPDWEA